MSDRIVWACGCSPLTGSRDCPCHCCGQRVEVINLDALLRVAEVARRAVESPLSIAEVERRLDALDAALLDLNKLNED